MSRLGQRLLIIAITYTLVMLFIGFFAGRASAHEPYTDWKQPGTTLSCCNDHDCQPVTASADDNGTWTANVNGRQVRVPPWTVLKIPSPDGRSHWCGQGNKTYCFVPGEPRG